MADVMWRAGDQCGIRFDTPLETDDVARMKSEAHGRRLSAAGGKGRRDAPRSSTESLTSSRLSARASHALSASPLFASSRASPGPSSSSMSTNRRESPLDCVDSAVEADGRIGNVVLVRLGASMRSIHLP